ncbi:hypothetical protein OH799_29810 [Nocardia sp. NBC_00881]|uniref:hypothetical protein n=1 Tax=Nocardia sp. NBC_00881 TaxID=2975995 RepID=UPI0038690E49|nr:hypothetical protein OH799_29810 [Nocardia sp. NBC_00881]
MYQNNDTPPLTSTSDVVNPPARSALCSTATLEPADEVRRVFGREPEDFADYATETAPTGIRNVSGQ